MTEKKFAVTGPVSVVSTGKKEVHKEDFEKVVDSIPVTPGTTVEEMYDHYTRLIYVIDASGSMGEGMLGEDAAKMYIWDAETLAKFRAAIEKEQAASAPPEDEEELEEEEDYEDLGDAPTAKLSDEELKTKIVMEGLEHKYGIWLTRNYNYRGKSRSKMQALKEAAKEFVHKRFEKFPDARVLLYMFEYDQKLLSNGGAEGETLAALNRLPDAGGGGTNIFGAVDRAVNDCKKTKGDIGANHIVLVSDGLDGSGRNVEGLLEKMKELRVVFDFIFMQGGTSMDENDSVIASLRDVCERTGGEFTIVKTEKDFQVKFLAASSRLCLPPGPGK